MRVVVISASGVRFEGGNVAGEEGYCSCARRKSPRDIEFVRGEVRLTIPDGEHAAVVLVRSGSSKPVIQRNPSGVSVFATNEFMTWVRFAESKQRALQYLRAHEGAGEKYVVSTKTIEKIGGAAEPSKIFLYESSFGDVFGSVLNEGYQGEQTGGTRQMRADLKRSSYTTLDDSYPECWR